MSIKYLYLDLTDATLLMRRHKREIKPPNMVELKNVYIAASDGAITLRPDFGQISEATSDYKEDVNWPSTLDQTDGYTAAYAAAGSDRVMWFTSFMPLSGSQILAPSDDTGTVSGKAGDTVVTGAGSSWADLGGNLVAIDGDWYIVRGINSDTELIVMGTLASTYAADNYFLYDTYHHKKALGKIHVADYGGIMVFAAPCWETPIEGGLISGPWKSAVTESSTYLRQYVTDQSTASSNDTVDGHFVGKSQKKVGSDYLFVYESAPGSATIAAQMRKTTAPGVTASTRIPLGFPDGGATVAGDTALTTLTGITLDGGGVSGSTLFWCGAGKIGTTSYNGIVANGTGSSVWAATRDYSSADTGWASSYFNRDVNPEGTISGKRGKVVGTRFVYTISSTSNSNVWSDLETVPGYVQSSVAGVGTSAYMGLFSGPYGNSWFSDGTGLTTIRGITLDSGGASAAAGSTIFFCGSGKISDTSYNGIVAYGTEDMWSAWHLTNYTFNAGPSSGTVTIRALSHDGTNLVAYSNNAKPYYSTNSGSTWTQSTTTISSATINCADFQNSKHVVCGSDGKVWNSADGDTYTSATLDATYSIVDITYDGTSKWYALGWKSGTGMQVWESTDLAAWTSRHTDTQQGYCIEYCSDRLIVGGKGRYWYSTNGTTWIEIDLTATTEVGLDVTSPSWANFYIDMAYVYSGTIYILGVSEDDAKTRLSAITFTDADITSWPGPSSGTLSVKAVSHDGTNLVAYLNNAKPYYSADDGENWTQATDTITATTILCADYQNSYHIACGDDGNIWYSNDGGDTWTSQALDATYDIRDITFSPTLAKWYALGWKTGTGSQVWSAAAADITTWGSEETDTDEWFSIEWCGDRIIVGGYGRYEYSTDGSTYTEVDMGNNQAEDGIDINSPDWSTFYVDASGAADGDPFIYGMSSSLDYGRIVDLDFFDSTDWDFGTIARVSSTIQASSFIPLGSYLLLLATREYDAGWTFYPRRVRWNVPGDITDWSGTGSGTADTVGNGAIYDGREVNGRGVTFETSGVGVITPTGFTSDPFHYELISSDVRAISNPVVVNDRCFFIDETGLLYYTDGISVQNSDSAFDITKYSDYTDVEPVWLIYSSEMNSLLAMQRPSSGAGTIYTINLDSGAVSSIEAPTICSSNESPFSILTITSGADDQRVIVSYPQDDSGGVDQIWAGYLEFGNSITGKDTFTDTAAEDEYWHSDIQTGEIYPAGEGNKTIIRHLIARTYSDGTTRPDLIFQTKSIEDTEWHDAGDSTGTVTVSTTACTGTGTAWSNKIGRAGTEVDGSETVFTLPCPADKCRVFLESGGSYTEQTSGTDYTTSGNSITFATAPGAGNNLYAFDGFTPKVEAGDYIQTTEGWHRITSVDTATTLTLSHYLSTGSDATATHHPAENIPSGDGEVKIGMHKLVEGVQIRVLIIPQSSGDSVDTKLTGIVIGHEPAGRKVVEATGS
jgi:photosystem II stability/assembly factor-like uncharacterized protein